ncbi:hypothetical protein PI125_g24739 [Phytophthora idaei]|nr:hypothetical protein PI125_g24739 [Phytophthora idaei]
MVLNQSRRSSVVVVLSRGAWRPDEGALDAAIEEAGNGREQDKSRATEARREAGAGNPDDSAEVQDPEPDEPELSGDCPVEATSTEHGVTAGVF